MWIEHKGALWNLATAVSVQNTDRGVEVRWADGSKLKLEWTYRTMKEKLVAKPKKG